MTIALTRKSMAIIGVVLLLLLMPTGCLDNSGEQDDGDDIPSPADHREAMRELVINLSGWAKAREPGFAIIPQNGQELLTDTGAGDGKPHQAYLRAIDGQGREDLFYGYTADDIATPTTEREWMLATLELARTNGIEVLVTDYCDTRSKMDDSYDQNAFNQFISFAADHRELDNIPSHPEKPYISDNADNANKSDRLSNITFLAEARNFLYLLDPGRFDSKQAYLDALANTTYDLFIIDAYFDDQPLSKSDVDYLKEKPRVNESRKGGRRQVIAYMSIGEAEEYRPYWQAEWKTNPPDWLADRNPDWEGNWKVRYWDPKWQQIIYGEPDSYLGLLLESGFDGVYLDIIDAFEYFEED